MEAASIPETPAGASPRNSAAQWLSENILWVLLGLALVYFFVQEPKQTLDDVKTGLSNGTIWALIALGYTLVYGIIELINFAHGEVFMIGSFVAVSLWGTLGVTDSTGIIGILGAIVIGLIFLFVIPWAGFVVGAIGLILLLVYVVGAARRPASRGEEPS